MNKFEYISELKDLISSNSRENLKVGMVIDFEENDASLIVQVGKKKFSIQIREIQ